MRKDLAKLFRTARERGWRCERTRAGHVRMRHPCGALVFSGTTPSDARALRNLAADLARVERQHPAPPS